MELFFQVSRRAPKGPGLPDDLGVTGMGGWGSEPTQLSDYAGEAGLLLLLLQLLLRLPPRQDYSQTEAKDDCTTEADVTTVLPTEYWTLDKHIEIFCSHY